MKRRKFSPAAKKAIRIRQDDKCPYCNRALSVGRVEYDHILPLALGGADDEINLQAVHSSCHSIFKTAIDRARIVKADRQGQRTGPQARLAARKAEGKRPTFPSQKLTGGGFPKTLRKKMNGTVERVG